MIWKVLNCDLCKTAVYGSPAHGCCLQHSSLVRLDLADNGDSADRSENFTDDELRDELCDPYDLVLDMLSGKAY